MYRFKTRKLKIAAAEDVGLGAGRGIWRKKAEVEIENLEKRL